MRDQATVELRDQATGNRQQSDGDGKVISVHLPPLSLFSIEKGRGFSGDVEMLLIKPTGFNQ